ncbi:TIGR03016 family PEP-CTERM system-associated outer membrane protein [Duganella sp. SAP-35]|uniref:TIGR03016 family PEP-CTERM system-associated outer membrane protein n=2 Tax=Duganella aceris TaxID=2703883 RepID=A0ABX0FRM9_9BURK|nr:TIGR03016 family PEP-CTERM system-associated outer membrane protein [Duganella aceris]
MISLSPHGTPWRLTMLMLLTLPGAAVPADWQFTPTLRLRESYTDNMNLAPPGQARGEFTTEVSPGVRITGDTPRLRLALSYSLQKLAYTRQSSRTNQQLDADGHAEVVPDWLFFDARSGISQHNVSAFGPQQLDPAQATGNTGTVHTTSISPYLRHQFQGLATALLRYSYQRVGSGGLLDVRSSDTALQLIGDDDARGLNWSLNLDRMRIDDAALPPVIKSDAALTLSHPLTGGIALFGTGGYEKHDYHSTSSQPQGGYWSVGGTWTPSPRTRVAASLGRRYFGKTYTLDAAYRMRDMFWTLNYNEDITTMHGEFLSIAPTGLSDFLYQLWATRIPDPETRLRTIKVFMAISQMLGPDGNVNFFSHRYYLQKQLRMATVYSTPRSTLGVNLSSNRRTAQTSSAIDSVLLGPDQLSLTDKTRQSALQLGWSWRMSARDNLTASASHNRVRSLTTGRADNNSALVLGMSRQLQRGVNADVNLRHARHTSNAGGNYRENGVSAALMVAF